MTLSLQDMLKQLPYHMADRCRVLDGCADIVGGRYVLYWMHSTLRCEQNYALSLAKHIANQLGLGVLVLQEFAQNAPYYNPKTMQLLRSGASAVAHDCKAHNVLHRVWSGNRDEDSPLIHIARRAAAVVTDDMPTPYHIKRLAKLVDNVKQSPIIAVDSHCFVPMQLQRRPFHTLDAFIAKSRSAFKDRLMHRPQLPDIQLQQMPVLAPEIAQQLTALKPHDVVQIDVLTPIISHLTFGYPELKLGSHVACYMALAAYLRYGLISIETIVARIQNKESAAGNAFINDMVRLHDCGYAYAHIMPRMDKFGGLPKHIQETLIKHQIDVRPSTYSLAAFQHGKTNNDAWNRVQRFFIINGFIPEQVMPFWARTIMCHTHDAQYGFDTIIQLYMRNSTDVDSPASLATLLQGLSYLEEGEAKSQPVLGTAFGSHTAENQALNCLMQAPALLQDQPNIAIIGAGVSGLAAAHALSKFGISACVFEGASRAGGRMRSATIAGNNVDIGTPFFTCKSENFKEHVDWWNSYGLTQPWDSRIYIHENSSSLRMAKNPFAGVPTVQSTQHFMAEACDVTYNTSITAIDDVDGGYRLRSADQDLGFFDKVIVAMPPKAARKLLSDKKDFSEILDVAAENMQPILSVSVCYSAVLDIKYDALAMSGTLFSHAFRDSRKPQRDKNIETWVIHAEPTHTQSAIDHGELQALAASMVKALPNMFKLSMPKVTAMHSHLWEEAYVQRALGKDYVYHNHIGLCGDWLLGRRVEDAWLSGYRLGHMIGEEVS